MPTQIEVEHHDQMYRLLERPQHFRPENIPWEEVADTPVDPRYFPVFRFFESVEKLVDDHYADLVMRNPLNLDDPLSRDTNAVWRSEEGQHGIGWENWNAHVVGPNGERPADLLEPLRLPPTGAQRFGEWLVYRALPAAGRETYWRVIKAVGLMIGEANEDTTASGYRLLGLRVNHPVLRQITSDIGKDEGKHLKLYRGQRKVNMADLRPTERRLARFTFRHVFRNVGVPARPEAEFGYVAHMLDPENNTGIGERIDKALSGEHGLPEDHATVSRRITKARQLAERLIEQAAA